MKRDNIIAIAIIYIFSLVATFFCLWLGLQKKPNDKIPEVIECSRDLLASIEWVYLLGEEDLNESRAVHLMQELGIEHPHIVFAQMRIESGNFKSNIATTNNNFFGMKHPKQRITTSKGNKNGYASYENWALSVVDYGLWQRRYASGLTEDEYYALLKDKYAEDDNYVPKVKGIAEEVKMCINILEYQKK